jgi:hypothetical protein
MEGRYREWDGRIWELDEFDIRREWRAGRLVRLWRGCKKFVRRESLNFRSTFVIVG